jgi:hypothetical protein
MDASMDIAGRGPTDAQVDPAEAPIRRVTWGIHRAELAIQAAKEPGLRAVGVPNAHYAQLRTLLDDVVTDLAGWTDGTTTGRSSRQR